MVNLALLDLVRPSLLRGQNLGALHAPLSVLRVVRYETATDALGTVIRGRCEFTGQLRIDPLAGGLSITGLVDEAAPAFDPADRKPVFDIRETAVEFELFVPREGSAIVAQGVAGLGAPAGFATVQAVLNALDGPTAAPAPGLPPSDYPGAGFTLDLILEAPVVRPPFLHPAKLGPQGTLVPDPTSGGATGLPGAPRPGEVAITLPKLRFRLSHDNTLAGRLRIELVSAGTAGLDDPGDIGVAELIAMQPPYAYLGGPKDQVIGIGFRSATLDLSDDYTPAALKEKAGVGDDWTGLYLPEARVFVSPAGQKDFAFEAGAKELLIGLGETSGVWGDFEAALVDQGSGSLTLSARFVDQAGARFGIERLTEAPLGAGPGTATTAEARIPEQTRMVVDVEGGRPPYTRTVTVAGAPPDTGAAFVVDLSATAPGASETIEITVTDASPVPITSTLTISASKRVPERRLPVPSGSGAGGGAGGGGGGAGGAGTGQQAPRPVVPGASSGTLVPVLLAQTDVEAVFGTAPVESGIRWSVDGGPEVGPRPSITVPVAVGSTHTIRARVAATAFPSAAPWHFTFDEPKQETSSPDLWTTPAISKLSTTREPGGRAAAVANAPLLDALPEGAAITLTGQASWEGSAANPDGKLDYNFLLAGRRARSAKRLIQSLYGTSDAPKPGGKNFVVTLVPSAPGGATGTAAAWQAATGWGPSHGGAADREFWRVDLGYPVGPTTPERSGELVVTRPAAPVVPVVPVIPPVDPQPTQPKPPSWFRSAFLKVRIVDSELIALELQCEIDIDTMSEEKLRSTNQLGAATPPRAHTMQQGTAVGNDNPADGITVLRILAQTDPATGRVLTLMSVGADPADKDGLFYFGWLPGDPGHPHDAPVPKDLARTLLGSYLTFWPMLAEFPPGDAAHALAEGQPGAEVDVVLAGAALAIPGVIAALPWFQVERVIVFGAEYQQTTRGDAFEGRLLFDIGVDWSANLLDLITIDPHHPLSVRYKAIGLRFGDGDPSGTDAGGGAGGAGAAPGADAVPLRPIFDSSRGYTIDLQSGGSLKLIEPLGQILKILGARLSKSNPLTLEIEIGLGVDLGVVSIEKAGLRAYLSEPRPPELTALAASVDIPGALVGSGYVKIGKTTTASGAEVSVIAGQLDLTLRPIGLRIAAALAVAQIPAVPGVHGEATGVYVGLNVVLPVGLPLGTTGLGIFGFRGIFGMHYQRNPAIGAGAGVPALEWLKASGGQPHLLAHNGQELWTPEIDHWAFGLGILIGTMEGGVILNLDGTFLLELPGPRVLIMMNARIISPPPSLDGLGSSGGILAVIEISPEHFLIGIIVQWEIEDLIKIVIPIEAVFPFGADSSKWHIYLGARPDLGQPVEVDVLGIVKGTGYLVFKGDGLEKYPVHNATLPAIKGFGIALGVGASFTWGDTDIGLYLRIGGGMDAVLGFDPFVLAGTIWVAGELRLFIISIGADAQLTVIVNEQDDGDLELYIHGEACGHVSFLFFEVSGCVDITISSPEPPAAPMPALVEKLSLKSRSPALLAGTGVDRGIDASLGDALPAALVQPGVPDAVPAVTDARLPVVPIDAIPVISMTVPPTAPGGLTLAGVPNPAGDATIDPAPGVPGDGFTERGGERYRYELDEVLIERIDPATGAVAGPAVQGSVAPVVWWTINSTAVPSPVAQLALFTWEPSPATKAIEKTDHLVETIIDRWGTACADAAPPAEVLWTFRWEELGPCPTGWRLDGLAWPDPAGSLRSSEPDTELAVTERWRSGSAVLDQMRGLLPAVVIAGAVPCRHDERPEPQPGGGAIRDGATPRDGGVLRDPRIRPLQFSKRLFDKVEQATTTDARLGAAARSTLRDAIADTLGGLRSGAALHRAELLGSLGATAAALGAHSETGDRDENGRRTVPASRTRQCVTRLLQAPVLDDGRTIWFGDPSKEVSVATELKQREVWHGPLDDVVRLHTDGYVSLDLLLFVPSIVLERQCLVVRSVAADDSSLDEHRVSVNDLVANTGLPGRWTDADGPWAGDVADLLAWSQRNKVHAVFVHLDKAPDAVLVEIGTAAGEGPDRLETLDPSFFVAAAAEIGLAEVERHSWDQNSVDREKTTLTNLLGPKSSENVLLVADSLYRITVRAHGARQVDGATWGTEAAPETQAFWFRTDRIAAGPVPGAPVAGAGVPALHFASTPPLPVRLDPWLLVKLPGDAEKHVFGAENVRLVFNTHDVERLLAAYGKEMRLRFQASTGRHPVSTPELPHPFPLVLPALKPSKGVVLSPWEQGLVEAIGLLSVEQRFCVPVDENRDRHSIVDIPIVLDDATDYILDIELVDLGAPESARGPSVLRRFVSTGAHSTFGELGDSIAGVRPLGRGAPVGAMEAVRSHFAGRLPAGSELDDQLRATGLEPLPVPTAPRVTVFWQQATPDDTPQPAAVLIDATAPLHRSRPYPSKIVDDTGPEPADRWILGDRPWLVVRDASAAGVVAANGLVRAPGEQRMLVVLVPNARGKALSLDLVDLAFPDLPFLNQAERRRRIVQITFDHAPWEEV